MLIYKHNSDKVSFHLISNSATYLDLKVSEWFTIADFGI